MDKGRNASTSAKKTGDLPQSLEMRNTGAAESNERSSYLSQKARSMSLYGSQFLEQARRPTYALFCLSETNPVRKLSKLIVESKIFEYFILLAIGANCIVLALATPLPENDRTDLSIKLDKSEYYFVGIFCIEALLKIMAFGFVFHPGSYLRSGWNILDFVVVVVGIITLPETSELFKIKNLDVKALRAVRVLRPLKLISGVPSLQVVMKSIVRAMVPLLQIALLVLFCILIYAIIGMEFLKDKFHFTCFKNGTGQKEAVPRPCDKGPWPGVRKIFRGRQCPYGYQCNSYWGGPNDGISTFDNIALAMITVFQCITMEGWTQIMYRTFDAMDRDGYLYAWYFVSLIVIGSFFVLNLVLGVLSGEFAKERERVDTRRKFFKVRRQQQLERQVHAYQTWIDKAEEIAVDENGHRTKHLSLNDSQSQLVSNDMVSNPGRVVSRRQGNLYRVNMPVRDSAFQRFMQWKTKTSFKVRAVVKTQAFYWTVLVCVFLNTIVLAVEYHGQPQWLKDFQRYAEIVFLAFFFVEMMLKLFGLGINQYFSSSFNCFDCAVVFSGILDMILEKYAGVKIGSSVLRCVRLLRVFKVTRHWRSLRNLATSLVSSIRSIVSLIFLLFLFILIAALLGMQIFGGKFIAHHEEPPTTNFDNFQNAMLAVFQILTGEDWNSVMYNGINALGGPHTWEGILVSLYFILLVILGNYTLLNVFLAIAVDNLANAQILTEDEELEDQERLQRREVNKQKYSQKTHSGWRKAGAKLPVVIAINHFVRKKNGHASTSGADANNISMENGDTITMSSSLKRKIRTYKREASYYDKAGDRNGTETAESLENTGTKVKVGNNRNRRMKIRRRKNEANGDTGREEEEDEEEDDRPITRKNFIKVLKTGRFGKRRRPSRKSKPLIKTNTMFIFSPENRFRRLCHRIVNLRHFDSFMLIIIVLSSITIAFEDPLDDKSKRNEILMYFDYIFTAIFALEVIVKVVDIGIILHKGSYFRDWWNVIDALVVSFNMASLILYHTDSSGNGKSVIKALRVFRVLRPFKGVHKIKKLQAVFRCMWYSVKNVANILIITMLFLFIFAVMGVQLFSGKFQECNDKSKLWEEECKGQYFIFKFDEATQQQVVEKVDNRTWTTRKLNFDNVAFAMLTLYTSSTGEGWPSAMHRTMATSEENKGPIDNYSPGYAIYYISFVVVFSFFFLNIFVALIILTFQEEGEREIASCELDRNQRDCIQFALTAKPAQRYMPTDQKSLRYKIWKLVMSKPFDTFILVLIALNTGVLMSQHYGEPSYFKDILIYLNIGFTVLYVIEAGLKFFALRLNYFRDYWNIFDFIVVLGGLLDVTLTLVVKYTQTDENPLGIGIDPSMFRLFRAARLIKLLRRGYTIRILLWTFLQSFKALPYVTLLISLMFFMYAVIGMQLFGKIKLDPDTKINENNNFRDLGEALQVLFRSATGEDWHEIMKSCYSDAKCDPQVEEDYGPTCGTTLGATVYFCTFIFLCMFLMLNLFVAVIMDNFEYLTRDESILGPHHLDEFVRVWSEFDPGASGCVHHSEIYKVMCSMSPPVGFGKKCPRIVGYKRLIKMNMPVNEDNTVSFSTTLFALIRTSLNIKLRGNMNANDTELRKMIKRVWPKTSSEKVLNKLIPKQSVLSCQQMTIGKIYCAKLIHENYKYLKRKSTPMERIDREEERSHRHSKGGLFSRLVGSLRHKRRHERQDIELGRVERRRDRAFTSDARLNMGRNPSRPTSLEDKSADLQRHSSWGPRPKLNGDINKNGMQPHPESSRAMMEVSVPCSVATPSLAEQFREQTGIPSVYLTPSERRSDKVPRLVEGASIHLDSSSDSDTGVDVDQDPSHLRQDPYYEEMITRINCQLEAAVASGTSPYAIYGLEEDDADDWC